MGNFKFFGGIVGALCFSMGIFLLLGYANAHENRTYPMANVNLNPNQKWRSAYFCLMYRAAAGGCAGKAENKGKLTPEGKLEVSSEELDDFCNAPNSCADNIRRNVLDCIYLVHRHFHFQNNVTVKYLYDTINKACANTSSGSGISVVGIPKSSGIKVYQRKFVSIVSGLLVFLAMFDNIM